MAPTGVVCDDAPGFRILLSALLGEAGIAITGIGDCWPDAERMAPGADVIVVDLWMPSYEPDALARVRAAAPDATLAVVTALELGAAAERLAPVAVDLVLSKSSPPTELAAAIAGHAAGRGLA